MKRTTCFLFSALLGVILLSGLSQTALAQERGNEEARISPNASVSQTIGTTVVSITYGRPGVRDREIFGGLTPYGQPWRTGANESTAITFSDNVLIEGEPVEAGTYSLYSIPGEEEWTIIINDKLSWGTQYDENEDVLRVTVTPEEAMMREQFMINFRNVTGSSAEAVLHWDTVAVPFTIEVDE